MSGRFETLSPVVLRMLRDILEAARRHDVPITLCGEMAGRPLEAMALLALGFRSISMAPASIGPIKAMIRSLDTALAAKRVHELMEGRGDGIRQELEAFAREHDVTL